MSETLEPSLPATPRARRLAWLPWLGVLLALIPVAVVFGWGPIGDMDTWLHLAMGRWMVENRQVMTADPWTFAEPGARVVPHEWLFQILQYSIYNAFGPGGLAGLRVVLIALTLAAVLLFGRKLRANPLLVMCFGVLALYVGASRLSDRPHLATFICVPLLAALLESWRRSPTVARTATIAAVFWIWGQCHGGVLYGIVILGVYAAEGLARSARWLPPDTDMPESQPAPQPRAWLILGLICIIAPMLGPAGPGSLFYGPETLGKLRGLGLATLEFVGTGDGVIQWIVLAGMILATGILFFAQGRRDPRHAVLLLVFALGTMGAIRDRVLWFLLAAAPLAALLGQYLESRPADIRRTLTGAFAFLTLALTLSMMPGRNWSVERPGMAAILPDAALAHLERIHPGETRVFTPDYLGAYLNWKAPGRVRPFLDARMDAWSPALLRDHTVAMVDTSGTVRQEVLDRRNVDALLLDYPGAVSALGIQPGLRATAFDRQGAWALVYWDDVALLFVRRTLAEQKAIPPFDQVNPADPAELFDSIQDDLKSTTGPVHTQRIAAYEAELRRAMTTAPDCAFAPRLLAHMLTRARRYAEAAPLWREAITRTDRRRVPLTPGDYEAWIGTLTDAGKTAEAQAAQAEFRQRRGR